LNSFCTKCGSRLGEGDGFCKECGAAVSPSSAVSPTPVPPVRLSVRRPSRNIGHAVETGV
jgi:predicted amidophosphoribosyltransferase